MHNVVYLEVKSLRRVSQLLRQLGRRSSEMIEASSNSMSSASSSKTALPPEAITSIARRLFVALLTISYEQRPHRLKTGVKFTAERKDWMKRVLREGPCAFLFMYRLGIGSFYECLEDIRAEIETGNEEMAVQSSGSAVFAELGLAMTLRYFNGVIFLDIRCNFDVSAREFYRSAWRVVEVFNRTLHIKWDISDIDNLRRLESEFAGKSQMEAIRGAVGALNGFLIWQKRPGVAVDNPSRYFCWRKEKFALLLMAICGAKKRFYGLI